MDYLNYFNPRLYIAGYCSKISFINIIYNLYDSYERYYSKTIFIKMVIDADYSVYLSKMYLK